MKFIAGPCVIESAELLDTVAERLVAINKALGTDIIFKASFDKANRTSISSFRGPGLEKGLRMLADVRAKWGLRLLTDIHEAWQAAPVGEVVDVIQIPAFLCRQTDLLTAAARTGKTVNIKKAQFLSGLDMQYPYEKARDAGQRSSWRVNMPTIALAARKVASSPFKTLSTGGRCSPSRRAVSRPIPGISPRCRRRSSMPYLTISSRQRP